MGEDKTPEIAAGKELVGRCPFSDCGKKYSENVATDVRHTCPACKKDFMVTSFEK